MRLLQSTILSRNGVFSFNFEMTSGGFSRAVKKTLPGPQHKVSNWEKDLEAMQIFEVFVGIPILWTSNFNSTFTAFSQSVFVVLNFLLLRLSLLIQVCCRNVFFHLLWRHCVIKSLQSITVFLLTLMYLSCFVFCCSCFSRRFLFVSYIIHLMGCRN